jgi:tyrosyl-tRNA synthetase
VASAAPITSRPGRSAGGCRFNILALARDLLPVCAEKIGIEHGQGFGINRGTCYTTGVSRAGAGQDHVQTVMAMNTYKSDFLNVLATRGFIHQISEPEALDALARSSTIAGYIGFDCTAPSLHVGSLLPIMMLYWMQQTGHRPIALMGGGTTRVGDPSGKDESRRLLSDDDINQNLKGIRAIFSRFLRLGDTPGDRSGKDAVMANNADWLNELNYIDFLRDIGRHFSINRMLTFDSVKLRLERQQELSFLEFNYMILQAYDFVELYRRYGCVLQMGGSDQWGNIVSGIDLGRRMHNAQFFALTAPLIMTSSGAKMGKTASGAVWLNADQVSAYEYWQYWRNTDDADVARFLKLFTVLPLDEIERLAALKGAEVNEAKKVLATEATALVHGRAAADEAAATARTTFEEGSLGAALPTTAVKNGESVVSVVTRIGFSSSNTQARQFVKDGAVYLGDVKITDISTKIAPQYFGQDGRSLLQVGKKRGIATLESE